MDRPKSVVRVVREVANISCFLSYKTPKLSGSIKVLFLSTRPQFSCFLPTTCLCSQTFLCSVVSNTQSFQFSQFNKKKHSNRLREGRWFVWTKVKDLLAQPQLEKHRAKGPHSNRPGFHFPQNCCALLTALYLVFPSPPFFSPF